MVLAKMHENEVATDESLVRRLLLAQFPRWADRPIVPVPSAGTDNALYRLGEDLVVRLPRIDWAVGQVDKEHQWMPRLAPFLPLLIPAPLEKGQPGEGYPWEWSIYQWHEGENTTLDQIADPVQAAVDLAEFLLALQSIDTGGGPDAIEHKLRGAPLVLRDRATRGAIATMDGMMDCEMATAVWETALEAPDWDRPAVWFHGDLLPGNLLFREGRLRAVIDFGGLGVGDPACDLMIAWGLFAGKSREAFRSVLAVDDAAWARGRGQALSQAAIFVPYYLDTNRAGVHHALHMIDEVLADYQANG
jgi:aminoglycoside phosphotransferase (APT) family kinase protein